MTIRILTDADVPAFHRIRRRALQEEPQAFSMMPDEMASVETLVERFKANWDGQSAFVMGAFGPELVAIVGCARAHHIKRRHAAEVWGCTSCPSIADTASDVAFWLTPLPGPEEWSDLEQLWLDVTATNEPARTLYLSCGFRAIGTRRRALTIGDRYYDEEII